MKKDIYNIKSNNITLSTRVKEIIVDENEITNQVIKKMKEDSLVFDEFVKLMLLFRGEKIIIRDNNGEHFKSKEDIQKELIALKEKYNVDMSDEDFIAKCSKFYKFFVSRAKAREFANIFLNPKDVKIDKCLVERKKEEFEDDSGNKVEREIVLEDYRFLRESGILPLKCKLPNKTKYAITQSVHSNICSFQEKQNMYDSKKQNYEEFLSKKEGEKGYDKLYEYSCFIEGIKKIKGLEKFNADNFKRFINNWRGRVDKETGLVKKEGMKHYFAKQYKENPNKIFISEEKHLFGYDLEFMNFLFHDCRNLWVEFAENNDDDKDYIGHQNYVTIAIDNYHWLKDSVAFPLSNAYGKIPKIPFGNNFTKFKMFTNGKDIILETTSFFDEHDSKTKLLIKSSNFNKNGIMPKITELTVNKKDKKSETGFKEVPAGYYEVKYTRDSKGKTHYKGVCKEPALRYNPNKKSLYLDLALSSHREDGINMSEEIIKEIENNKWLFKTATSSNPKEKEKREYMGSKKLRVLGVDFGIHTPITASALELDMDELSFKILATEKSNESKDISNRFELYKSMNNKINHLKMMMDETFRYLSGLQDSIKGYVVVRKISYSWSKIFDINPEEYEKFLKANKKDTVKETFDHLRCKSTSWDVSRIFFNLKKEIFAIKGEFMNLKGSEAHVNRNVNCNFVDRSFFEKRSMVKNMNSLGRKYSFIGRTSSENEYLTSDFNKTYKDWYEGLTRHSALKIAADTVNMARKHGARYIFIEDLDIGGDIFADKSENKLKALWGCGTIKKALADKACKHGIAVIEVDPHATSVTDPYTGKRGYRPIDKKRSLFVKRNDGIIEEDSDSMASINIALRGVKRHSDISTFRAHVTEDNKYLVEFVSQKNKDSKIRKGAFFKQFNTDSVIFVKNNDSLKIEECDLSKSEVNKLVESRLKTTHIINNNGCVYLKDDLDEKLKEYYNS